MQPKRKIKLKHSLIFVFLLVIVHGNWGEWTGFTQCNVTCGEGVHTRARLCDNPSPANGGSDCLKSDGSGARESLEIERRTCNKDTCPGYLNIVS